MQIYIGTSGYNYRDWREKFYPKDVPQSQWLSYFSTNFNTVEINATFYRSFPLSVFDKWNKSTPEDFKFTIKGSRLITHIKRLKDVEEETNKFFESSGKLDKKLAIVLWQFPASFNLLKDKNNVIAKIKNFLSLLSKQSLTRLKNAQNVFEFRHESLFVKEIFDLFDTYKAGFVVNDTPAFASAERVTGKIVYIRFHGPGKLYSTSYSDKELEIWAGKIKEYLKSYDVYCYFNNDVGGFAVENAKKLRELVVKPK